jgi:predicted SnoaL-like aldol condensation-catalyzing enzyme
MSEMSIQNHKTILEYFETVFIRREPAQGAEKYLSSTYCHHGPGSQGGIVGFVDYFRHFFEANPRFIAKVLNCVAEGEFVVLLVDVRLHPLSPTSRVAEFYRLQNGRISDHWHVIQKND